MSSKLSAPAPSSAAASSSWRSGKYATLAFTTSESELPGRYQASRIDLEDTIWKGMPTTQCKLQMSQHIHRNPKDPLQNKDFVVLEDSMGQLLECLTLLFEGRTHV